LPLLLCIGGNFEFVGVLAKSEFHIPIGICVFFYLSDATQLLAVMWLLQYAVIVLQVYLADSCLYYCDAADQSVEEMSEAKFTQKW